MSTTIDNRIVEMQFQNEQFEAGAKRSMATLKELKQNLDFSSVYTGSSVIVDKLKDIANHFSFLGIYALRTKNQIITSVKEVRKELFPRPQKNGLNEYELQLKSIQTILANTKLKGTTLDDVTQSLGELNTYADKTIYNFAEMTKNIGTFTAAGVELKPATAAIKGISNLAAMSGSTPQQAATAMYQLSQALAAGTIRLMDWNSVVNASMGGETFQEALKETARAHGISVDAIIKKNGSFRESLHEGWLTSEVMLDTLKVFTGDLSDAQLKQIGFTDEQIPKLKMLGETAFKAATQVRTFTQLIDTTKEALGSGWAKSFEYIIGNFEEATELWTDISDTVGAIVGELSDRRNRMLAQWHDMGGREKAIKGLTKVFKSLWGILMAVKEGFREIFPPLTAEKIYQISTKLETLGTSLEKIFNYSKGRLISRSFKKNVSQAMDPEKVEEFSGEILKLGSTSEAVKKLQEKLKALGYYTGAVDGVFGKGTLAALKEFQKSVGIAVDGIFGKDTHESLSKALLGNNEAELEETELITETLYYFGQNLDNIKKISKGLFSILGFVVHGIKAVGTVIFSVFTAISPLLNVVLSLGAAISESITSLLNNVNSTDWLLDWIDKVSKFFEPFKNGVSNMSNTILSFLGLKKSVESADNELITFSKMWESIKTSLKDYGIWDALSSAYNSVKNSFSNLKTSLTSFKEYLSKIFTEKKDKFDTWVKDVFNIDEIDNGLNPKALSDKISVIGDNIRSAIDYMALKISNIPLLFNSIKTNFNNFIAWLKTPKDLDTIVNDIRDFFGSIHDAICNFFGGDKKDDPDSDMNDATEEVKDINERMTKLKVIWEKISNTFNWLMNSVKMVVDSIGGAQGFVALTLSIYGGKAFFGLLRNISDVINISGSVISSFGNGLHIFNGFISNTSSKFDALMNAFTEEKKINNLQNKMNAFASLMKSLALLVGIIIGAIYILGKMPTDVLKQGAIALGGIIASILFITGLAVFATHKISPDSLNGLGEIFKRLGRLFVTLGLSLYIIIKAVKMLGRMNFWEMTKGLIGVAALLTSLAFFVKAVNKSAKIKAIRIKALGKLLISVSLAIGMLAVIVKMLGSMDSETEFIPGLVKLATLMAVLGVFVKVINRNGRSVVHLKGLVGLSVSIGILVGVVKLLSIMSSRNYIIGMARLIPLLLSLALFIKIFNKVLGNKAAIPKLGGLVALSVSITLLTGVLWVIGTYKWTTIAKGIAGLTGVMLGLATFMRVAKGLNIKAGIGILLSCIGLTIVITAFVFALHSVKNIDPNVMITFASSLGIIIASLAALTYAMSKIHGSSLIGSAVALSVSLGIIFSVISAIVWGLGTLDSNFKGSVSANMIRGAEMLSAVGSAMKDIGKPLLIAVGTILGISTALSIKYGGTKASIKIAASASAISLIITLTLGVILSIGELFLSGSGYFNQNGKAIENIRNGGEMLAAMGQALDQLTPNLKTTLAVLYGMGALLSLAGGAGFGVAFKGGLIAAVIEGMFGLIALIAGAILVGFAKLGEINVGDGKKVKDLIIEGGDMLKELGVALGKFIGGYKGGQVEALAESIATASEVDIDQEKVDSLISNVTKIHDLAFGIGMNVDFSDVLSNIWEHLGGESDFTKFCNAMPEFTRTVNTAGENIRGISGGDFSKDIQVAVEAASSIFTLAKDIKEEYEKNNWDVYVGPAIRAIGLNSPFSSFCNSIGTFSESIKTAKENLSGLRSDGLDKDVQKAIEIANQIALFMAAVKEMNIEPDKGYFEKIFTGDTIFNTVVTGISTLATNIKDARADLEEANLTKDVIKDFEIVSRIFGIIVDTFSIPTTIDKNGQVIGQTQFDAMSFSYVIDNLKNIGDQIKTFMDYTKDIDVSRFASINIALAYALTALNTLYKTIVDYSTAGSTTELDTSKWFENLDADVAVTHLVEFISGIRETATKSTEELSQYADTFNNVGKSFAIALSSGTESSGIDTFSAMNGMCSSSVETCRRYISDFQKTGSLFGEGLARGIEGKAYFVKAKAAYVAQATVDKVNDIFEIRSPSRVAKEIGEYFDMGLGNGISDMSTYVTSRAKVMSNSVIDATQNSISGLTDAIDSDMNADPVIRPVVDLTNVRRSANTIDRMMPSRRAISLATSTNNASAISVKSNDRRQNGDKVSHVDNSHTDNSAVNITGNTFTIRSEQDINSLASEIAALTRQQQRSYGAR